MKMPSEKWFIHTKLCFAMLLTDGDSSVGMVVTSPGMPSEGGVVYQDLKYRINAGTRKGRSVGVDPPNGACSAAAGKCEENQHPDRKSTGFVTTLSGQILVLS